MLYLLCWGVFGLIVGLLAKLFHPEGAPIGFLPTILVGVAGSYIGGLINWVLGIGGFFAPSGFVMSIIGGVIFCWIYRTYKLNQYFEAQKLRAMSLEKKD